MSTCITYNIWCLFSYLRFYSQDDNNVIPSDSDNLKEIESQISNSSVGSKDSLKSDTNLVKKPCIIRRTTSLYTGVKRIKSNKKTWQAINRRSLKNHNNTIENNLKTPVAGSKNVIKSFLKTSRNRLKNSRPGSVKNSSELQCANKRLTTASNKFCKTALSSEETAIVKHGAKRLKILSMNMHKGQPEIGESSKQVPEGAKLSSKVMLKKQNVRGASKAITKHCHKMEQNKSKSSKSKKSVEVEQ